MTDPRRDDSPSVDAEHPWIGLASFTESTRTYFNGRDNEITELCRRIQRKPLTVLFGKSGLGKTSILQAGVVPRLRDQGYCPVYLRIDYAADAPSAAEQIKQAIVKAAEQSGRWTRAGVAEGGESLWAFLHHRDDVLLDSAGQALLPLLIFDQFEEIFTLAQADEQGRERAAAFTADLAELVENRPPAALDALLENDDSSYERYDLARADYRVVVSLREDYLAHLEGLKAAMPSITQNRLRLAPMTGAQALSAIIEPGRHLVNDEVAAAIVRFVAGGAEVAHAEVEPSLLSLICRELNDQRIALGRSEIGADLLAGSHTTILGEFYERSVADQPSGVRTFIEDHLLTDSGYRENVAEERVRSEFVAAGAQPEALALLVNRRLLRIEERLDLRRVELTHDVLCAVLRASRDQRREREALEASERLAANQAERARLAQRALKRARAVATVCILLAVGAVAASGFAVVSSRREQQAERDAQATRTRAEQLLTFLQKDFSDALVPLGRTDLSSELNDRVVDYFNGVSHDERTPDWTHDRALALLAQADTRLVQGRAAEATEPLRAGLALLESRYTAGHRSEADLAELGAALSTQATWLYTANSAWEDAHVVLERAATLFTAATNSGRNSDATRMGQADVSSQLCYVEQLGGVHPQQAVASCETGRRQYANLGALDISNPASSAEYLWTSWSLTRALNQEGRSEEALGVGIAAVKLGHALVVKLPAYSDARSHLSYNLWELGTTYAGRLELNKAEDSYKEAEANLRQLTQSNSTNSYTWNDLALVRWLQGSLAWEQGDPELASQRMHAAIDTFKSGPHATAFILTNAIWASNLPISVDADRGDQAGLANSLASRDGFVGELAQLKTTVSPEQLAYLQCDADAMHAELALTGEDRVVSARIAGAGLAAINALNPQQPRSGEACRYKLMFALARAQYESKDAVASEVSLRGSIKAHDAMGSHKPAELRIAATLSTWLALAQIRQGHLEEARVTLTPVLVLQRGLASRSTESAQQQLELAAALYAQALTQAPGPRRALLAEATTLVSSLPAPMRTLRSVQMWKAWIDSARDSTSQRVDAGPADALHPDGLTHDAAPRSPDLPRERKT